jgi:putative redox protein
LFTGITAVEDVLATDARTPAPGQYQKRPIKEDRQMSMTATARRVDDTLAHEVDVNGRHVIVTDEPERLGGGDHGPAPHELLAATVASCVATMIAMYARNRGWDLGETTVHVDYDPDSVPRRLQVDLHLPEYLDNEQRSRLERVARTCPVRRALEAGFDFQERTVAARAPAAALR